MIHTYIYFEDNCYIVKSETQLVDKELAILIGLICGGNDKTHLKISEERLKNYRDKIELGPLLNFSTPWCSNAISIINKCGIYNTKQ